MDAFHYFGNDLSVSHTGDLLLADGLTLSQQRILRRLLTNPGDYIFHLNYGAGLPSYIGKPLSQSLYREINGVITTQMYLEATVSQNPPPVVGLSASQNAIFVNIEYTDATTNQLQLLSFSVS